MKLTPGTEVFPLLWFQKASSMSWSLSYQCLGEGCGLPKVCREGWACHGRLRRAAAWSRCGQKDGLLQAESPGSALTQNGCVMLCTELMVLDLRERLLRAQSLLRCFSLLPMSAPIKESAMVLPPTCVFTILYYTWINMTLQCDVVIYFCLPKIENFACHFTPFGRCHLGPRWERCWP